MVTDTSIDTVYVVVEVMLDAMEEVRSGHMSKLEKLKRFNFFGKKIAELSDSVMEKNKCC